MISHPEELLACNDKLLKRKRQEVICLRLCRVRIKAQVCVASSPLPCLLH